MSIRSWLTGSAWTRGAIAIALVAGGVWLLASAGRSDGESQQAPPRPLPVQTLTIAGPAEFEAKRSYTGIVVARREAQLSFERNGRLVELLVDEGSHVAAGDVIARLDRTHLEMQVRRVRAERDAAGAMLEELQAGPRKQTIAAAEAELRDRQSQLASIQADYARRESLLASDIITDEEFEQLGYNVDAAQARLEMVEQKLAELRAGTRREQIAAQSAVVEGLDAALADLEVDMKDTELRTPFAGTISVRSVDEGTVVAAGAPIVSLVETGALEARVGVPPEVAQQLAVGQEHEVAVGAASFVASVKALLPQLDPATRTRTVVLEFAAEDSPRLLVEQVARLKLARRLGSEGYWLPIEALAAGPRGLWICYAVVEGRVEPRHVEVLHTDGDRVLVRGTIDTGDEITVGMGDEIIASGTHRVVAGQKVDPIRTANNTAGQP